MAKLLDDAAADGGPDVTVRHSAPLWLQPDIAAASTPPAKATAIAVTSSDGAARLSPSDVVQASAPGSIASAANSSVSPSLSDEVTFISGLNPDGTLALDSFAAWNPGTSPADYSGGYTLAAKWFANAGADTAGTPGGSVLYYFAPGSNWTATEKQAFVSGLSLWAAVANISFQETTNASAAQISIYRTQSNSAETAPAFTAQDDSGGVTDGTELLKLTSASIGIDTDTPGFGPIGSSFSTSGGYPWETLLHEEGHALGLGHAGPYNEGDSIDPDAAQYSAYDNRQFSIMSYVSPWDTGAAYYAQNPDGGANWGTSTNGGYIWYNEAVTWMPADILAIQRLYGLPTSTPLSGGQIFGFDAANFSGTAGQAIEAYFDFTKNTSPVITIWDDGTGNTLDLSGFSATATVSLLPGTFSSAGGLTDNIAIADNTAIDTVLGGDGADSLTANNDGDTLYGEAGNDTIQGGTGNDRLVGGSGSNTLNGGGGSDVAVYSGARTDYAISYGAGGVVTISGDGETDTLTNVEQAEFNGITVALGESTMPTTPTLSDEVTYVSGIDPSGKVAGTSYWTWNHDSPPATYSTTSGVAKWGSTTPGTAGGTISVYFDSTSNWTATEKAAFIAVLDLWSAVANISFTVDTSTPSDESNYENNYNGIIIKRGSGTGAYEQSSDSIPSGAGAVNGNKTATLTSALISIDPGGSGFGPIDGTFSTDGGYPWTTILHEAGHALGLGHDGPYNDGDGDSNYEARQYSAYDSHLYSIMSYIDPVNTVSETTAQNAVYYSQYPVTGTNWGNVRNGSYIWGNEPTTWMPIDILALQRLYGTPTSTPLNGGQTFGFNEAGFSGTAGLAIAPFFDFTKNTSPVITLFDTGTGNTLDLSGFATNDTVNLNADSYSSAGTALAQDGNTVINMVNNIAIAHGTAIDRLVTGSGNDTITANNDGDIIIAGTGTNTIHGGTGFDTVTMAGNRLSYTITTNGDGSTTISRSGESDTLWSIENIVFGAARTDFNADGKSDVLLQNSSSGQMAAWLAGGSGLADIGAALDSSWRIVGTGDYNGDGKADIFLQHSSGLTEVWTMNGAAPSSYVDLTPNPGGNWVDKAIGDFNGDGKADVLMQNTASGQMAVWLAGTSAPVNAGAALDSSWQIKGTGDYDGDGKTDIFLQHSSGLTEVWEMNGSAPSSYVDLTPNPGSTWQDKAVGDFNGDGKADLLMQNSSSGQMAIWLAGASGPVNTGAALDSSWQIKGVGDYNGDGKADIFLQHSSGLVEVWQMNGTAPAAYQDLPNQGSAWKAIGGASTVQKTVHSDFNGDGTSDVLMQNSTSGQMAAWLAGGSGLANIGAALDSSWRIVGTGDYNGDGKADIFLQHSSGLTEVWTMNGAAPSSYVDLTPNPGGNWVDKAIGDFNGDGKADVLMQNASGQMAIWLAGASGPVNTGAALDSSWQIKGTGDYNGDGKDDIFLQNANGLVEVWQMNGTTPAAYQDLPNQGTSWQIKATGDFNGDGKADLLMQNSSSGQMATWLAGASAPVNTGAALDPSWQIKGTGDFNGDGKADIFLQHSSGLTEVWTMSGTNPTAYQDLTPNQGSNWQLASG